MNKEIKIDKTTIASKLSQLDHVLEGQKKLLIVLHNNPDPDALASALALRYLVSKRYNIRSNIAYGGLIGRAENRAMVRELKIPLKNMIPNSPTSMIRTMRQNLTMNHQIPEITNSNAIIICI